MGEHAGAGEFETDLLVPRITQYLHQVSHILHTDIIDFSKHASIGIIIALSNSMRKQGRGNHDELFIIKRRPIVTPGDQRARGPSKTARRRGALVTKPFKIVLRCLGEYKRAEDEIAGIRI